MSSLQNPTLLELLAHPELGYEELCVPCHFLEQGAR